ncbi:hypothetical protein N7481_005027 [Penicillium waksmanii]|uniref:uncharacterized protein n=1 Tax=Penicillium waksmanii TaxID=69791 RepID=UPI0025470868|nr:uncharacterized protein N7481_005027 [Penicillium waksmanii]KAJ5982928.1 hypothetical protein N7481_005027 [Penicillium waksmanii]
MVNNDQYNGSRWPDEWDESHVQLLRANDPQEIQQELPTTYSPHPAFEDAAHMAQFAYAAYVREENQRRVSQSQPDADVRAPTPLERPVDSRFPNLPPSYEEGWLGLERRRQTLPQPEQHKQQQYQQHYQQPQQHLQYQSQYQTQHQTQYDSQQQRYDQRRQEQEQQQSQLQELQRQQEEHQKQQQQRRQIEQEKRIQKQNKRDQQEQQLLEQQRQNEEQQRQWLQQEQERGRREEQQRQQSILNAQRRQYERPFGASLSSPTFSHQSDDSRPAQNYTTNSAIPPQQFASTTAPMQAPAQQMPHSRFLPQMRAPPHISMERPTGTASVEQKKDDYLKSEIRSAGVHNAIARPQSRACISTPDEQRSLAAPAFFQTSPPREPYTSASRSTLEPRAQASSTSYTRPGPVAPVRAQMTSPNMRPQSLHTTIAPSLLSIINLTSDDPKRASHPSIPTRQAATPIPDHLSANRHASHASHASSQSPNTASPVLPSASGSSRPQSSSPALSQMKTFSTPVQAPSIEVSLALLASSQSQPPSSQPSPAPMGIFSARQCTGPLGQYKYQTSHPTKLDSVSAPAPSPLPKPTIGTAPQLSNSQRLSQAPKPVPSPPPSQSWSPARAAQSGPRFSQAPPSKSRRLNNGTKVKVQQIPLGPVAQRFKAGDYVRKSPSQSHIPLKPDMIQPMNNADALKKFSYDPATIAHDVLINCAKHPTERALNEHMEAIRNKFPEVDASKDLTTFRWDLVEEAQASLVSQNRETGAAPPVFAPRVLPPPAPIGPPRSSHKAPGHRASWASGASGAASTSTSTSINNCDLTTASKCCRFAVG